MTKPVMKQFPTYFTEEIYRRLRVAAAMQERSMTSLVAEIVEKELDRLEAAQRETRDFIDRHTGEGK